ncbi:MAG: hypothetical protein M1839_007184 [Geoglossum umbratile]|nr:MAG: hypothetical protein M1839_007184 [Geoglossum umbratile]
MKPAGVYRRYTDINEMVDPKHLDLLNYNSDFGNARTLFEKGKPSALAFAEGKNTSKGDWVESDTDEQLMLFMPFRAPLKVHTIEVTSLPPKTFDNGDGEDEDEIPMRPKTIQLYTNPLNNLGFDEVETVSPTQTFTLGPHDWEEETGTAKLKLRFVKFQNIVSLVMFIVDGEGEGDKVRLDRVRIIGESGAMRETPAETSMRSRKDDQLAFAVDKDFVVAQIDPQGDFETQERKMVADLCWQLGRIMQGDNNLSKDDDFLDQERWHRLAKEVEGQRQQDDKKKDLQDDWQRAVKQRQAEHHNLAQHGVKLWGLRGREQATDLQGLQELKPQPPGLGIGTPIESFADYIGEKHLCELCEQSPMDQSLRLIGRRCKLCDSLSELREKAKSCKIYMAILSSIEPYNSSDVSEINVFAERLFLSIEGEPTKTQATSMLRVFADLGPAITGEKREIPILPETRSEFEIRMCKEWLRVCDGCHEHAGSYVGKLPTRLIDVGHHDSNRVRLRVTNGEAHGIYIALSHRWESDTPTTTKANLDDRRNGIKLDNLPQIYQDVIRVTRKLGARFIWIDSLCIVQDDITDWYFESEKTDEVYASAYCTIAASSANEVHGSFEQDVENGELSQRGWILQERALSPRTIHFTGKQTYWECGSAIWSKTTDEGVRPRNILGSSEFPRVDILNTPKDGRTIFQRIFANYTRLHLTVKTDRPVAIAGLEHRLETFYRTRSVYGIVQSFFLESLLWQRSRDRWMEPMFDFKKRVSSWSVGGYRVPSWSWMAYTGEIRYGSICTDGLSWKPDVRFNLIEYQRGDEGDGLLGKSIYHAPVSLCTLAAPLVRIRSGCLIQLCGDTDCEIRDVNDVVGWIRYDCMDDGNVKCMECISLAKGTTGWGEYACVSWDDKLLSGPFDYVLLLGPVETEGYRRIGVGVILRRYLSPSGDMVRVF